MAKPATERTVGHDAGLPSSNGPNRAPSPAGGSPIPPPSRQRIVVWLDGRLAGMARAAHEHSILTLGIVALLCIVAFVGANQLKIDADLTQLLPKSFPSVRDVELLKERFGGVGYVVVVAQNADPEVLMRFADDVAPKLETLESVRYADHLRPLQFFKDRAMYFLEKDDLWEVHQRLAAREAFERRRRNPMYLDLEEQTEPPSLDFTDIMRRYSRRSDQQWLARQKEETYYLDRDRRMLAIFLKPASIAADLAYAEELVGRVRGYLESLDLTQYDPQMRLELTGRYAKKVDQQALIKRDLRVASVAAAVLMLLYLAFHFRRLLAVFLIIMPLATGLLWTFGFAAWAFGTLNVLTAFIGAILLGLGVDHGIHLLSRYEAEHAEGRSPTEAVMATFSGTGRAVIIAALTTTVAFAGLGMSEFKAFREFGLIAAAGMILVVTAYTVIMPSLLGAARRLRWQPRGATGGAGLSPYAAAVPRFARRLTLVSLAVIALFAAVLLSGKTRFDYDFNSLEANTLPSYVLDIQTNEMLGYSQTPVVVLTDSDEQESQVAAALRSRQEELGEASSIDFFAASSDFVPADQEAKREAILAIGKIVRRIKDSWVSADLRPLLRDARRMVEAEPFTLDDLPVQVRRQFLSPNGTRVGGFVLAFPAVSLADGKGISALASEIRSVKRDNGEPVRAAGEAMVLADILSMVAREAPAVLSLTLLAVFLTLWLLLGRLRDGLLCLAPAMGTMAVTLGLLPLVGLSLNYLNIVMIPVLFGIAVDGGAHLVTRLARGSSLPHVVSETGRAIAGAILTSALGFGALVMADHRGLNTLGDLALVGLAVNLLACLVFLPALLARRNRGSFEQPS